MQFKLILLCVCLALLSAPALGRGGGRGGGGHSSGGHGHSSGHSYGGGHSSGHSYGGGSHSYPSSHGMSGTGSSHGYPSSHGLSGYGRISKPPAYGGGSHPSQAIHSGGYIYRAPPRYTPTYYNAPQTVYIHQYRDSGSSYSNLLTGLTMYNLGRAHSHNSYYYHDSYSRSRYSDSYSSPTNAEDEANCSLRVEEQGQVSNLRIPCEIVSTFAPRVNATSDTNTTITTADCTAPAYGGIPVKGTVVNATLANVTDSNGTVKTIVRGKMKTAKFNYGYGEDTATDMVVECPSLDTVGPVDAVDPMSLKGPRPQVTIESMKCAVEVRTRLMFTSKEVDCGELIRYSKMPEPEREKPLVPTKDSYRSWMQNPPWWLSIFFVV